MNRGHGRKEQLRIPSIDECLALYDRFEMLANIRAHSQMVARVAQLLVDGLHRCGKAAAPLPDRRLVIAGALLHDIAKTRCLRQDCRHAEEGSRIMVELGYPALSEIVAEHVYLHEHLVDNHRAGIFSPTELVYYADKRVRHDQVVPLSFRLDYIIDRYSDGDPEKERRIRDNFAATLDLEAELFARLDFAPEEVAGLIVEALH